MNALFHVQAVMSLVDKITGPLRGVLSSMGGTERGVLSLSTRMAGLARAMLPVAIAAGALLAALVGPVAVAADFEAAVSGLGAISRASAADLAIMEKAAMDLGASTAYSAAQVVQGQTELAKKGFTANQIVAAMPGLLDLAAATQADLGLASSVASGALKSFGLEASKTGEIADIIAAAATTSATDIDGLSASLSNAGAVASAAGSDFATLAALTGKLADANINGAVAGTSIKIMFNRLQAPSGAAAKAIKDLGIKTTDAAGNMLPIIDVLGQIEKATASMGGAEKAMYLKNMFGEEAVGAVLALLKQGTGALKQYADELRNSTGTAAQVAADQLNNLNGALTILGSAWEGLQISIGKVFLPVLTKVTQAVTRVVSGLNALADSRAGKFLIGLSGVLAVVVLAVTAFAAGSAALSFALPLVVAGLGSALSALAAVAWPITLVAALVGALYLAWKTNFLGLRDFVSEWYENIKLIFQGAYQLITSMVGTSGQINKELAAKLEAKGLMGFVKTIGRLYVVARETYTSFRLLIRGVTSVLEGEMPRALQRDLEARGLWGLVAQVVRIQGWISGAFQTIKLAVTGIAAAITGNLDPALRKKLDAAGLLGLVETIRGVYLSIKAFFTGLGESASMIGATVMDALEPAFNAVKNALEPLGPLLKDITGGLFGAGGAAGDTASWQAFGAIVGDLAGFVLVTLADILAVSIQIFISLGRAIGETVGFIYTLHETIINQAVAAFDWLTTSVQNLWNWLSALGQAIVEHVTGAVNKAAAFIQNFDLVASFRAMWASVITYLSSIDLSEMGLKIMSTLAKGITGGGKRLYSAFKGALATLNPLKSESDAKEGPLSNLTASGMKIPGTLAVGVTRGAPALKKAMIGALSDFNISAPSMTQPRIPDINRRIIYDADLPGEAEHRAESGRESRKVIIQNLTVKLDGVKDGEGFAAELQRLVEQYDA